MLKKFPVFGSKFHRLACCAMLALTLVACGADNAGSMTAQSAALTSQTGSDFFVNGAPPRTSVRVGAMYKYVPAAASVSGRVLSYQITNKPNWATFAETNGELSGIPESADIGASGEIQIGVSDGTTQATIGPFRIIVTPQSMGAPPPAPGAPTIAGTPASTVTAGQPYNFVPTVTDSSGEALNFSIVNRPAWASFDPVTGALTGNPTTASVGSFPNILISVSTSGAPVSLAAFSIQVESSAAGAPTISGTPAATVAAGGSYSFTPAAGDPEGNALTFSILNAPSWAIFSASTGQLSGTPQSADVGSYSDILITVSDGHLSALLPAFAIQVTAVAALTPAQKLMNYMKGLSGKGILSGQYADFNVSGMMDQVPLITGATGQTPAILGTFLSFGGSTFNADPIALSNQWLAKGGIVLAMLSPGNPTHSAMIIGGGTLSTQHPNGHPVNFNNLLIPGTVEYTRWQAFLALLVTEFKAINGPIIVRPFQELNLDKNWWGVQPPAQFIAVWQQMVTYARNAGVTNVLWCLNFGASNLPAGYPDLGAVVRAYYPGDAYVDIVSLDSYPPSPANSAAITALTETGKPVIYAEMGAMHGPFPVQEFSGDTSAALATLISNYPQVVAAVVWSSTEALPVQNGMDAFMANPKVVNLAGVPSL